MREGGVLIIGRFPSDDAASMAVKGLTYTETIKLICDVEKGGGGGGYQFKMAQCRLPCYRLLLNACGRCRPEKVENV